MILRSRLGRRHGRPTFYYRESICYVGGSYQLAQQKENQLSHCLLLKQSMWHSLQPHKKLYSCGWGDYCQTLRQQHQKNPTITRKDNQGTIAIARNPISHARTKHIDIKFHYMCKALQKKYKFTNGIIELVYCPTDKTSLVWLVWNSLIGDRTEFTKYQVNLSGSVVIVNCLYQLSLIIIN